MNETMAFPYKKHVKSTYQLIFKHLIFHMKININSYAIREQNIIIEVNDFNICGRKLIVLTYWSYCFRNALC